MKEKRNVHLKVQELCDCYATNDPLKEMSVVKNDENKDEAAVKWLALAALHGVNNNAKEVTVTRKISRVAAAVSGFAGGRKNFRCRQGNHPY